MNLNNITLSPQLATDLYAHSLIEGAPASTKVKEPVKNAGKNYLGDNLRQVVIASAYPDVVFIPEETLEFLTSILTACKLTLADVAIINLFGQQPEDALKSIRELKAEKLLLFGVGPAEAGLPVRFPHFQKQMVNTLLCLSAPSLEEIKQDRDTKTRLWTSLKIIFNV